MILSTTSTLEGKKIKEYRGIVFGEVINGVDFFKDWTAGLADSYGGRAVEFERELVDARADAIKEMMEKAKKIGANALIGVKVDIETMGKSGSMLMVVATGTAVVVE